MTTPSIFPLITDFIASSVLGSVILFAIFIIAILAILILVARVSFKIGLILIFPAILALFGIGISNGIIGISHRWIGILVVIALAIGAYAFIWFKLSE